MPSIVWSIVMGLMKAFRWIFILIASLVAVASVAQNRLVKPGDVVRLTCEQEPSLNRDYTITQDGLIVLSFIGAVEVGGLSEKEAGDRVAARLVEERIVTDATVTVRVQDPVSQPIRFRGAVKTSGEIPFRQGLRLSDVLAHAQPVETADLSRIEINPAAQDKLIVDFTRFATDGEKFNPLMKPGDDVFIPMQQRAPEVFVLGGVARPGAVPLSA